MSTVRTAPRARWSRRSIAGPWLLVLVLGGFAFWAPSLVATTVSGDRQPTGFVGHPVDGWRFLGAVVTSGVGGAASTPGEALDVGTAHWSGSGSTPTADRAQLVWLPGDRTIDLVADVPGGPVATSLDPDSSLVWVIEGHAAQNEDRTVLGVVDFQSADVVWDAVREAEVSASPADPIIGRSPAAVAGAQPT